VLVALPPLRPWAAGSDCNPTISFWCLARIENKSKHSVTAVSGYGLGVLSKQRRDVTKFL